MYKLYFVKYKDLNDPTFEVRTDCAISEKSSAEKYVDWANKTKRWEDRDLEFFVEEMVYE